MTNRTYTVHGKGSVGPAHPSYRPDVSVTVHEDGARISSSTQPNGRAGHRWALEQGMTLHESQADMAKQPWYALMLSELGLATAASTSQITYTVTGRGSVGPAHPNYDPSVNVALHQDGRQIDRVTMPGGREGHRWALAKGYVLDAAQAHMGERPWYQDLLADIRHAQAA